MCGICGFNWSDERLIERMKERLVHRGPDDHGTYVAPGVSLGHRRLSIVDLSEAGRQPLSNEDGSGLDHFQRRDLQPSGAARSGCRRRVTCSAAAATPRRSSTPTRNTASTSCATSPACSHSRIWDAPRRRLVLARDRLGLKPLYYTLADGRLRFASEIKALLADPTLPRALHRPGPARSARLRVRAGAGDAVRGHSQAPAGLSPHSRGGRQYAVEPLLVARAPGSRHLTRRR